MVAVLLQHPGHTAWSVLRIGARHTRSITPHAATTSRPTTPPTSRVHNTQTQETDVVVIGSGAQGSPTNSLGICLLQVPDHTQLSVQALAVLAVQLYLPSMAFRYGQLLAKVSAGQGAQAPPSCRHIHARVQVTVCESHDIPGGAAHAWVQDGFHFESGPSLYSGMSSRWAVCPCYVR